MTAGGWSTARLGRMHDVLAGYVERGEVPGIVALVSRRGEVHVDAIGTTSAGGDTPVARDTIFRVTSMTKPVVAAAAMILVEECALRLDEPVDRLLPELAGRTVLKRLDAPLDETVSADRPITVRDLLTFRQGWGMVIAPPGVYPVVDEMERLELGQGPPPNPARMPDPDEWLRRLGTLPLMHQPGERWMYNTGSDILGVLIARAAGQPLDRFLADRVFAPLGMTDTGFHVPADRHHRFTTSYRTSPQTGQVVVFDEPGDGQWSRPPAFCSGSAGLVSTVDDYLALGRMLLDDGRAGGTRVLSRLSVRTMVTDHLTAAQKAASGLTPGYFDHRGWGFGMSVATRRADVHGSAGRFGWDGGLGTSWYCDPAEDLVGVLMTQQAWTAPTSPWVCQDFWTTAYQAIDD